MHRRQAPQRDDGGGAGRAAAGSRRGDARAPSRPGAGVTATPWRRPSVERRPVDPGTPPRIVALGGGHGLANSLAALRRVSTYLTAVVTVADNGGSSGRLRDELDVLPPGDLRQALAALCGDDEWGRTWAEVPQHRCAT